MNKLLGVIYLGVSLIFSSCAVTMTAPADDESLPLVYKVVVEKSDLENFVMVCEAVDGLDDSILEEMKISTNLKEGDIEPNLETDGLYVVFNNTEYETGIFVIDYVDKHIFRKYMDLDLKAGVASNAIQTVSINSEFSEDYRTLTVSLVPASPEGFYLSKDESFLFEKKGPPYPATIDFVKTQIFQTKDGVNYTLNGSRKINTADPAFDSSNGYKPYAIFYFKQDNSPFNIPSNLLLLVFSKEKVDKDELYFIQIDPADKFMTIRNYPLVDTNTLIDVKIDADYKSILIMWKWMHVA